MRPIRPERGVTLIELVVAIVIVGIIGAVVVFFINPLRQSTDIALRAELTDIADNALQRIGRDVKLALPNSVRIASSGGAEFVEFLALRDAGRYRADVDPAAVPGGTDCPASDIPLGQPGNDLLSFDLPDSCFKTIGPLSTPVGEFQASDFLALSNFGPGFPGQNAYEAAAANRAQIAAVGDEASRTRVSFTPITFSRALHDSPGKRFFVVSGPVSYVCNPDPVAGTIRRYWNYGTGPGGTTPRALQPIDSATGLDSGGSALIAEHVTACAFVYSSAGPQLGLLTMRITLSRQLFGGTSETISLYHAVHVNNTP